MLSLFTDGSVDSKSGEGFGAYLLCQDISEDPKALAAKVKLKLFNDTSSSRLELQALLWALSELSVSELAVYTDSQNIIGLDGRRERLEQSDYHSKNGRLLKNHELYKEYFEFSDKWSIKLHHIKGHMPLANKGQVDKVFSLVDKASRKALRAHLS